MKLYEYLGILWSYEYGDFGDYIRPICPVHRMELSCTDDTEGVCETCDRLYVWGQQRHIVFDYLRRVVASASFQDAEVISIDGIQTPQLKVRKTLSNENDELWIEARVNSSKKGKILVLYIGERNTPGKAQLFVNLDQEKLSFDHNDRKPEEIISRFTIEFPSGKKIINEAPSVTDN